MHKSIYPDLTIDEPGCDDDDEFDNYDVEKKMPPIVNRESDNQQGCSSTPVRLKRKRKLVCSPLDALIITLNTLIFGVLMWLRGFYTSQATDNDSQYPQSYNVYQSVAKNTAIMTIINTLGVFVSLATTKRNHVHFVFWLIVFSLAHTTAHCILGFETTKPTHTPITMYFRKYLRQVFSGVVLLVNILLLCASKAFTNYTVFYVIHIVNSLMFCVMASVHSFWLVLPCLYPLWFFVFLRTLRRFILKPLVVPIEIGKSFVFFELALKSTWLTRTLALNYLKSNNGNVVGWLSCKNLNPIIERHPFTILKTYKKGQYMHLQIMMSRFGDWKSKLYQLMTNNFYKSLYSCGVTCYLDKFTTDENFRIFHNHTHILFLLESLDIARFLSFITLIKDPTNFKFHTQMRYIELHYKFDDALLHKIVKNYCEHTLQHSGSYSSSYSLKINFYYVPDENAPKLVNTIDSAHAKYLALKRIDYNAVVCRFLKIYYNDKVSNKCAALKIVSAHPKKVDSAVKFMTNCKTPIVVV